MTNEFIYELIFGIRDARVAAIFHLPFLFFQSQLQRSPNLLIGVFPLATLRLSPGPHPLGRLGTDLVTALLVAILLLPVSPPLEPLLGRPGLEALRLQGPLEDIPDDGLVGAGDVLVVEQLVPEVEALGERGQEAFEHGAAALRLAVRGCEMQTRKLGHQGQVSMGRQCLSCAWEKGAGTVRLVLNGV